MFKFRRKKKATSKPPSPPPISKVGDATYRTDLTAPLSTITEPTLVTSGKDETTTSKTQPSSSSHVEVTSDDGEGDVFTPSSPQHTEKLYDLTRNKKWEEATVRCGTHPQDARWKGDMERLPIHNACYHRAPLNLIQQLHEAYNEGVKTTDNDGGLPLHYACCNDALEVIRYLVEAYGDGVKTTLNDGRLPIHIACHKDASLEVIRYLIEAYREGVKTTQKDGWLPLHVACQNSASLEVTKYLVELYGEGVKATQANGYLPLHIACWKSASLEEITYLVEAYGEGVKTTDKYGCLPLHFACNSGSASLEVITYLVEAYGEGVKTADDIGRLPLHAACASRASLEVITYLIEAYGEGVKTTNNKGHLPLHFACRYGALVEVITYLVEAYGEGVKTKNNEGQTPVNLLKDNDKLSEEDKDKAREILSSSPRTTSADVLTITTFNPPSTAATAASGEKTNHRGTLSSPATSTQPSTKALPQRVDEHGFEDDGHTTAIAAATTAISNDEQATTDVTGLEEESAAAYAAGREDNAIEHVETAAEEARSAAESVAVSFAAGGAPNEVVTTHIGGVEDAEGVRRETGAVREDARHRHEDASNTTTTLSTSSTVVLMTSTQPSTLRTEGDPSSSGTVLSCRGDDADALDEDHGTEATTMSIPAEGEIKVAAGLAEEAAAVGGASGRSNEAITQGEAFDEEARSTAVAEAVAGAASANENETEQGHYDGDASSSKEWSERLVFDSAPDEAAFRRAAERLRKKCFYELHRPTQHDRSSMPPTATQLLFAEHSSHHCHRWEVHCLYDTLLIPKSEVGTVCELKDVGYVAEAYKDDSSTDSTLSETDRSGGGKKDGRGDSSGGNTWTRRVRGAFRGLGIGGDKKDKKKLLVARYNYPYEGRGPATIFVRNERADHEGKDVMKVKGIDLQIATVADLKSEIMLEWHRDSPPQELCLLRENGAELCVDDTKLVDCDVVDGDMILLRQPRVVGMLSVDEQSALREWWLKTSPGRSVPLALHVLKCEGCLVDPTCKNSFRPRLAISFLPFYTPSNDNETQSRLDIKVCTLVFGVKEKEGDGDGMISQIRHRGFFVDRVHLALKLRGDKKPTRISSPVYRITSRAYGSRRNRRVAVTALFGERQSLAANGSQNRETSEATAEAPVHWWITGDETALAWDLSRQTWNSPTQNGGYTLYDVMDPRDIRDFKSKKCSGHNKWLENAEIPEVKTTYADPIGEKEEFLTASWRLDECQDPFHDPDDENITINERQTRATSSVKIILGLCEIRIVELPGITRQSYEVVKHYREVVIDQELQFAKISSAPKASSQPLRKIVTADASDSATPAAKTMTEVIRGRRWPEVAKNVLRIDTSECAGLFFLACRFGPSTAVVESFLQVDDDLPQKLNRNHELPVHVLCRNGAERGAIETLVRLYPPSTTMQSRLSKETPLGLAQTRKWIFHEDEQADVISFLRRESFAQHFDGKTGLPGRPGFDLWARIQPPGCTNAKVALLYIDIAGFKAVNDSAGHNEGDRILKNYAQDISRECDVHANLTQSEVFVPYEVYRMGGDEFAVVCKFGGDLRNVWETALEQLASSLSDLNDVDQQNPRRYSTFLRIGCATGSLSNIDNVLRKADELQTEVQQRIGVVRGEHILLSEIRNQGISNVSELWVF